MLTSAPRAAGGAFEKKNTERRGSGAWCHVPCLAAGAYMPWLQSSTRDPYTLWWQPSTRDRGTRPGARLFCA